MNKNACKTKYESLKVLIEDPVGNIKLEDPYVILVMSECLVKRT